MKEERRIVGETDAGRAAQRAAPRSVREGLLGFGIIVVLWELTARFIVEFAILLPTPSSVFQVLINDLSRYLTHTGYTFLEVVLGFLAGFALGFLSAVGIFYSALLRRFLYPILISIRIVPKAAFIPLLVLWFGIGVGSKVALATFGIFFLVLVQTLLGLRALGPEMIELGRTLQMDEKLMFRKMRLPAALPGVMVGVKLSMTYALTLVVVAEMFIASRGVGWLIVEAQGRYRTDEMLGGIVVVGIAGLALYQLGLWVERRMTFWNVDERA